MSYKDFIEKFVESSSLSEKDSKLLVLEMESDFYAKEKDLILNNETDTMKKIEEDFGDKDKLAEQMFLAHHKYLNIPILGPLLYFKSSRIAILLILILPLNIFSGLLLGSYIVDLIDLLKPDQSNTFIYFLRFTPGFIIPYLLLAIIFAKLKFGNNEIKRGSIIFIIFTGVVLIFTFLQSYFESSISTQYSNFLRDSIFQIVYLLFLLSICLSILNLLIILFKKIFR